MTQRYLGGIITANPTEPSENFSDSAASGMWTMQEALAFSKAGDWPDPASINPSKFIENLFSTYTYTGTGNSLPINNGIDLSSDGGLVWTKRRNSANSHWFLDSVRGGSNILRSNTTEAQFTSSNLEITSFNSAGYTLGTASDINSTGGNDVSWTFRKKPKFFDIVTYTGDGSSSNSIAHNLGGMPGFIVIKRTDSTSDWHCIIRYEDTNYMGGGAANSFALNTSVIANNGVSPSNRGITTTHFDAAKTYGGVGSFDVSKTNVSSATYVAYLWAHNDSDGGFGSTGDQDIIKCGGYTGNGSTSSINLGFEPQWILIKNTSKANTDWIMFDAIRGIYTGGNDTFLFPKQSAEDNAAELIELSATGFNGVGTNEHTNENGHVFVYVAIRKGLMKAPTAGTDVLAIESYTGSGSTGNRSTNILVDTILSTRPDTVNNKYFIDRIRGGAQWIRTETSEAEGTQSTAVGTFGNNFLEMLGSGAIINSGSFDYTNYLFRRAPSFFDVVAYTGTGATPTNVSHNLGVTPELIIVKNRSNAESWAVFNSTVGKTKQGFLNTNGTFGTEDTADQAGGVWGDHTSSIIQVGTNGRVGTSSQTYVAYLFATLAGVSKVGTYSGTGSDVNVDCGFTSGARFVLAKRTDSSGSWYIWDSTNGIVSGNDPYLLLENTAAQVTNTDYIDPLSSGFTITSNAGSDLNHNGGTYVFLAIA